MAKEHTRSVKLPSVSLDLTEDELSIVYRTLSEGVPLGGIYSEPYLSISTKREGTKTSECSVTQFLAAIQDEEALIDNLRIYVAGNDASISLNLNRTDCSADCSGAPGWTMEKSAKIADWAKVRRVWYSPLRLALKILFIAMAYASLLSVVPLFVLHHPTFSLSAALIAAVAGWLGFVGLDRLMPRVRFIHRPPMSVDRSIAIGILLFAVLAVIIGAMQLRLMLAGH